MTAAWLFDDGKSGTSGDADQSLPWWSFSKTIIAACAQRLQAEDRLDLDAPCEGEWTLRQLLRHDAGAPCYARQKAYHQAVARREVPWSRERLMAEAPNEPLFPPGKGWAYSNIGYMLARERIEAAAECDLGTLAGRYFGEGLTTFRLARSPSDFAGVPGADGYHPGWVYHGCFMGTPPDAVRVLSRVLPVLEGAPVITLGGPLKGRPWVETGYGLGVMAGCVEGAGRVVGHSGSGPFSSCAIYRFEGLPRPVCVATFGSSHDEALPEWEACRIALAQAAG